MRRPRTLDESLSDLAALERIAKDFYKSLSKGQKRQLFALLWGPSSDVGLGGSWTLTRVMLDQENKKKKVRKSRE